MKRFSRITAVCMLLLIGIAATPSSSAAAPPDPVLEWINIMNNTVLAGGTPPFFTSRVAAMVSASVFDAVNGIDPRYRRIHVPPNAPGGASPRAAAIEAAYVILADAYPTQAPALTAQVQASLAALAPTESAQSISDGGAWGQTVANAIWAWRQTDGFAPPPAPFEGVLAIVGTPAAEGYWRPTPSLNAPGAGTQLATMTPWVLVRASQFRLPPPYALSSAQYAADLNETKTMGAFSGSPRTADQSELALFWQSNTPLTWNRVAAQISAERGLSFQENVHLFALLNVTMADAVIACWDSKYRYSFWRPVTAIREGLTPADADPTWEPWLDFFKPGTPAFPEYPSAHASISGSAALVLASIFGNNTSFTVTSESRPGTRSFSSFSSAVSEIADARVFGGIHFRTSCDLGNTLGRNVANFVARHAIRPLGDDQNDQ
ncbi:MAG TPA: vanadium-dependent haloperoxidase [Candidatus Acidoferrum sp.]|nr:vanadium-dependent haloperoxidase [Candidatus Acidoferrum sp.]